MRRSQCAVRRSGPLHAAAPCTQVQASLHRSDRILRRIPVLVLLLLLLSGCSIPKIVILHDPLSADEHVRLGTIYESQGKSELARDQYRAATEQDARHARAWALLGDLSFRLDDLTQAEKAYRKAMDLDPQNGDLYNNLAWVYARADRNLGTARELVVRAMTLMPDHRPYYLDTLGVVLLKQGKTSDAIAALTESVATIPQEQQEARADAYLHLAEAYTASGDRDLAAAARDRHRELMRSTPSPSAIAP